MVQFAQFGFQIHSAVKQTGLSLEAVCKKMKAMGYDYLDLSLEDVLSPDIRIIRDCGINVSTIYWFPDYSGNGGEMTDRIVDAAVSRSARFVMAIPSENHESDAALEKSLKANFEGMNRLASSLKKHGVGLILEDFDWGNHIFAGSAGLKRYLDAVPELRVCLDTGNFRQPEDKDTLSVIKRFLDKTEHVHFKDRAADDRWGDGQNCPVGAGQLPMAEIAALLKARNFAGVIAAEHGACFDQMAAAELSIQNMKKWFC